jgi:hypothetical protein
VRFLHERVLFGVQLLVIAAAPVGGSLLEFVLHCSHQLGRTSAEAEDLDSPSLPPPCVGSRLIPALLRPTAAFGATCRCRSRQSADAGAACNLLSESDDGDCMRVSSRITGTACYRMRQRWSCIRLCL